SVGGKAMTDLTDGPGLTDEEKKTIYNRPGESFRGLLDEIADAATAKALWWTVRWLRSSIYDHTADRLEAYLTVNGIERP
ncbi:MAG: hypothetical protein Q8P59_15080, partial [Dehalococcoidia bacterium]|nr:hypothetical protein [Dehalococcoidia bacterium]